MLFERVETATPELTIGGKPPIHVGERLGPQPVPAPLALSAHTHDTGVAQDAQMLRHPRLADREPVDQLADGPFAVTEQVENPPALRVREDVEGGVHTRVDYSIVIYPPSDIARTETVWDDRAHAHRHRPHRRDNRLASRRRGNSRRDPGRSENHR